MFHRRTRRASCGQAESANAPAPVDTRDKAFLRCADSTRAEGVVMSEPVRTRRPLPPVVDREQWERARAELLAEEKAHMRHADELAAKRRALPMVRVEQQYVLDSPNGPRSLLDIFEGRNQLIVYHFMFHPE